MATCWTCGIVSNRFIFACTSCEESKDGILEKADKIAGVQGPGLATVKEELSSGFSKIAQVFEWGLSNIYWELWEQTSLLSSIDRTLKSPSETKANEWRKFGEELRRRGILDKSEDYFLRALDANPLDYRTYIGLGYTYLQANSPNEAKKYFEESLLHAPKNQSFDYKSYSYRLLGHLHECQEQLETAIDYLQRSISLSPNYEYGYYDLAKYLTRRKNETQSFAALKKAISINPEIFIIAENDIGFNDASKSLKYVLNEVYNKEKEKAKQNYSMVVQMRDEVVKAWNRRKEFFFPGGRYPYCLHRIRGSGNSYYEKISKCLIDVDKCTVTEKILNFLSREDKKSLEALEVLSGQNKDRWRWQSWEYRHLYNIPIIKIIREISKFLDNVKQSDDLSADYITLCKLNSKLEQLYRAEQTAIQIPELETGLYKKVKTSWWQRRKGYPSEVYEMEDY